MTNLFDFINELQQTYYQDLIRLAKKSYNAAINDVIQILDKEMIIYIDDREETIIQLKNLIDKFKLK